MAESQYISPGPGDTAEFHCALCAFELDKEYVLQVNSILIFQK